MSEPWLERWQEGRIGWHEPAGNSNLKKHWTKTGARVLVPLCGKSPDLLWLAEQGNEVVGVELSEIAAHDFFTGNKLSFGTRRHGGMRVFESEDRRIRIVCGDYFEFEDEPFEALYDRASLIALPRDRRPDYARHTDALLTAGAYRLLVSLEYEQALVKGPPFSVLADEVRSYWPALTLVDTCEDIENAPPKFRQAGVSSICEKVWLGE